MASYGLLCLILSFGCLFNNTSPALAASFCTWFCAFHTWGILWEPSHHRISSKLYIMLFPLQVLHGKLFERVQFVQRQAGWNSSSLDRIWYDNKIRKQGHNLFDILVCIRMHKVTQWLFDCLILIEIVFVSLRVSFGFAIFTCTASAHRVLARLNDKENLSDYHWPSRRAASHTRSHCAFSWQSQFFFQLTECKSHMNGQYVRIWPC